MAEEQKTSTRLVRAEIRRFLASKEPEVLCIRGEWGVGKTFAWNELVKEASAASEIALSEYAYVSLFSVQNLDELKYAIFENSVPSAQAGSEPTVENLIKRTTDLGTTIGRRLLSGFLRIFINTLAAPVQSLSFWSVRNQVICFDDIERKGERLRVIDVLGLISLLRERRKCKVVLILNENELGVDRADFEKFQEKVIDSSLVFAPNERDCIEIALGKEALDTYFGRCCTTLKITNIRIIKKIQRLIENAHPLIAKYDPALEKQFVQTLTLFGYGHFGRTGDGENKFINFAVNRLNRQMDTEKTPFTEEETVWDKLLTEYDFGHGDELDVELLRGVQRGFFDEERIGALVSDVSKNLERTNAHAEMRDAWRLFHDSLADNEADVVTAIHTAFCSNVQFVSPAGLSGVVRLLKQLGRAEEAAKALAYYMRERQGEDGFYDLSRYPFRKEINDPDVVDAFNARHAALGDQRSPSEVWLKISEDGRWNTKDIPILSKLDAAQTYEIFKTARQDQIQHYTEVLAHFASIGADQPDYKQIADVGFAAFQRIAGETRINRVRLAKYGIRPQEPS